MTSDFTVVIDMDKKCAECGKGGAAQSGICMKCVLKIMKGATMKSSIGRAVAERMRKTSHD